MSGELRRSVSRAAARRMDFDDEHIPDGLLMAESLWWIWWNIARWANELPALTYGDALSAREWLRWFYHSYVEEDGY